MVQGGGVEYLFVYGSLRVAAKHSRHHWVSPFCTPVGQGFIHAKLYSVVSQQDPANRNTCYPGAVASCHAADKTYGDVLLINNAQGLFGPLDDYEGCGQHHKPPYEFYRQPYPVTLTNGTQMVAWVYFYGRDVSALPLISSGNFLAP